MTKFCDGCPLRYQAYGELDGIVGGESVYENRMMMGRGPLLDSHIGLTGVLVDESGNPSWPMKFPGHDLTAARERYEERIDSCNQPITETRGILRKKLVITGCAALGAVGLHEQASAQILRSVRLELM